MRPIEFRVWHEPTRQMHEVNSICFEHQEIYIKLPEDATDYELEIACEEPLKFDDCIFLQFTGLFDIRGNKLWEGDAVRRDMVQSPEYLADGEEEYSTYEYIIFHKGGFAFFDMGTTPGTIPQWDIDFCTDYQKGDSLPVHRIGCIYKNPELLDFIESYPLHPDHIPYGQEVNVLQQS